MNLHRLLLQRAADRQPLRVALIGAGKFGSMFLSQVRRTPGLHLVAVCDLAPPRARESLQRVGWPAGQYAAASLAAAHKDGTTFVTDDALAVIRSDAIEIAIDATGNPAAGIRHALACCEHGKHIVMVNVEADALAGPLLARRAAQAGVVYSLAYGDQPALICEMVDWARAAGFQVVAAGKGTKYLPAYHHYAARDNERNEVWIDRGGQLVVTRQVVGILARRIVCRVGQGARVSAGQRFGVMKFGSRIDLFLPRTATILVKAGDKVVGGETTLATLAADK